MNYKLRTIREESQMPKARKSEVLIKDLVTVMPTLRKHHLEAEIHSQIKQLRAGRTQKNYVLELSRAAPVLPEKVETKMGKSTITIGGQSFTNDVVVSRKAIENYYTASAPISRKVLDTPKGKVKLLRELKTEVLNKVRAARKSRKAQVEQFKFTRWNIEVPRLAEIYLEPGTFLKLAENNIRLNMRNAKAPKTKDNHIGVEIEFASKQTHEEVCDALFEAGVGKNCQVKQDGSIAVDQTFPHKVEVNIIAKQSEIYDVISKICVVLNTKLDIRIDKSCGLHVHVDMRNRDHVKSYHNFIVMQRYLYGMVPAKRKEPRVDDRSGYSQPIQNPAWFVPNNHYYGVNAEAYQRYSTIELRMHCGTSQARKINNWIKFLLSIADAGKIEVVADTIAEMQLALGIDNSLVRYVDSRLAKFSAQHKKFPNPNWMGTVKDVNVDPDNEANEGSEVA